MIDLAIPDLGSRRLEIGCGSRARAARGAKTYVGVDVVEDYLAAAHRKYPRQLFMLGDWREAMGMFEPQSFDAVYAIDFIEHLGRLDGKQFLKEAFRLARLGVAVFTPNGPMPQRQGNGLPKGAPRSQVHCSAWTPDDFPGWQIKTFRNFHRQLADGTPLEQPIGAFWALRRTVR